MATYQTIIYKKEAGIGLVTLNRPERRNALNLQLIRELRQVIDEIEVDNEVRTFIITGNSDCFSAGADLKEIGGKLPPTFLLEVNSLFNKIEDLDKASIAAISGWCLAGGSR